MSKLSIIVPIYNVEKYLNQCLNSLVNQQLREIEIILVDDGSPDNCPTMSDQWKENDKRVKVIHKKNEGLGFARNSGLEMATGEYVTFVDSDDFIAVDTYQFLLDKYDNYHPDVIYYQFTKFNEKENVSPCYEEETKIIKKDDIKDLQLNIIAAESKSKDDRIIKCSACTSIYRRETIEKYSVRFHSERELVSEDMIFNLDFLSVASIACIDYSSLYFYRNNLISLTHTIDEKKLSRFDCFDKYLRENCSRWGLNQDANERISRLLIGTYRATLVSLLSSSNSIKEKKRIFQNVLQSEQITQALKTYPWRHYSPYQKLFYLSLRYKLFWPSLMLATIRSMKR